MGVHIYTPKHESQKTCLSTTRPSVLCADVVINQISCCCCCCCCCGSKITRLTSRYYSLLLGLRRSAGHKRTGPNKVSPSYTPVGLLSLTHHLRGTHLASPQRPIGLCARRNSNQPQTDALMCVDEDDNLTSMMEAALEEAPQEMVALVKRRNQELKVRVAWQSWFY